MVMNPFRHERRGSMTALRRAEIFAAHDGRCHICKRKLGPADDWDVEHIIALENGGTDDDDNKAPCCDWCHTPKTADDHRTASKGKRRYAKAHVPKRFQKSRSWR